MARMVAEAIAWLDMYHNMSYGGMSRPHGSYCCLHGSRCIGTCSSEPRCPWAPLNCVPGDGSRTTWPCRCAPSTG
eukprot:6459074-Amphidinium_carterae.1